MSKLHFFFSPLAPIIPTNIILFITFCCKWQNGSSEGKKQGTDRNDTVINSDGQALLPTSTARRKSNRPGVVRVCICMVDSDMTRFASKWLTLGRASHTPPLPISSLRCPKKKQKIAPAPAPQTMGEKQKQKKFVCTAREPSLSATANAHAHNPSACV